MSFVVDSGCSSPAYLQIAAWLDGRIRAGEFSAEDKLPSERALSAETGAARDTIKAAYRELERRGRIRVVPGSGVYVNNVREPAGRAEAAAEVRRAVHLLRSTGLCRGDIVNLVQDFAWSRLQDKERPRLAWVDCCPEMLGPIAREIEVECGFSVEPMLLQRVMADPNLLARQYFHTVAASIEHYDVLSMAAQEVLHRTGTPVERIVLSLTPETIAGLASLEPNGRVAVVHESPTFFDTVGRYLSEFGVKKAPVSAPVAEAGAVLSDRGDLFAAVVLPPDAAYGNGVCKQIARVAEQRGCKVLFLRHAVDFGSLRRLKTLARACY